MRLPVISEEKLTSLVKLTGGVALLVAVAVVLNGSSVLLTPGLGAAVVTSIDPGFEMQLSSPVDTVAPAQATTLSWSAGSTFCFGGTAAGTCGTPFQTITTNGAMQWEAFQVGGVTYLAIANQMNSSSFDIYSNIYKWTASGTSCPTGGGFGNGTNSCASSTYFQRFNTQAGSDWEAFTIGGVPYLAISNGGTTGSVDVYSHIYKWTASGTSCPTGGGFGNGTNSCASSTYFQRFTTTDAFDVEAYTQNGVDYLAFMFRTSDGVSPAADSEIYKWTPSGTSCPTGGGFGNGTNSCSNSTYHQRISTSGGGDWEYFTIGGEAYAALANKRSGGSSGYSTNSKIFKWTPSGTNCPSGGGWGNGASSCSSQYQLIPTVGAADWEYFTIDSTSYLALANQRSDAGYNNITSRIYRWTPSGTGCPTGGGWGDGTSSCNAQLQQIATMGAVDTKVFVVGGDTYLAVANLYDGSTVQLNSGIYRWLPTQSCFGSGSTCGLPTQQIASNQGIGWEPFVVSGRTFLALANFSFGPAPSQTVTTASKIFEFVDGGTVVPDCTVYKHTSAGTTTLATGNVGTNVSTGPLTETTDFTLTCTMLDGTLQSTSPLVIGVVAKPTATVIATAASAAENPVTEGTFTVTLSTASTSDTTVYYTLTGVASNGNDYAALPGSVVVPANQMSETITVTPIDDMVYEGSETVVVTLSAHGNYDIGVPSSATVTITDDETSMSLPTLTLNSLTTTPSLVRKGQTTILAWDIDGLVTGANGNSGNSCTIGAIPATSGFPVSWPGTGSTWVGSASPTITVRTTFTLTCVAPNGVVPTSVSKTVGTIPVYQEI